MSPYKTFIRFDKVQLENQHENPLIWKQQNRNEGKLEIEQKLEGKRKTANFRWCITCFFSLSWY